MLSHCKNNAIHCKINDMCIAVMLIHYKNNAHHAKVNDICIALMLIHRKTTLLLCILNSAASGYCDPALLRGSFAEAILYVPKVDMCPRKQRCPY